MSAIRGREIGRLLRAVQNEAGWAGREMADRLGCSESRLSRMLTGNIPPTEMHAAILLAVSRVRGARRERILALCRAADDHVLRLTHEYRWEVYLAHARTSCQIVEFNPAAIPWLAQTQEYTRALFSCVPTAGMALDEWVAERREAVSLLSRREIVLLVTESALRGRVGSPETMSDQLDCLLMLAARPAVTVRVIPAKQALAIASGGGFSLLTVPEDLSLVHREEPAVGVLLSDPADVAVHRTTIERLTQAALPENESQDLINTIAAEFSREASSDSLIVSTNVPE